MLGARNSSQTDEYYTRGKNENIDVSYISQSYFGLPSNRNNSDRIILFKQNLRDFESLYKNVGGYDMKYDEFNEMSRETWSEKINYLCIDVTKKKRW